MQRLTSRALSVLLSMAVASVVRAQQAPPKLPELPTVRVTLQIDSATSAQFTAHDFELRVSANEGPSSSPAEVRLVKQAGVHTGSLLSLAATGAHIPSGVLEVADSLGHAMFTLRLSDVAVMSDRVTLSASSASMEQQLISQLEALSALTADYQEAQRQLATAEELFKSRGSSKMDLARARDRATDLQRRLDLLKQRHAILLSQQTSNGPLDETLVLHFGRLEIDNHAVGGQATITVGGRPPKS